MKTLQVRNLGEVSDFQGGSQPPKSQFSSEFKKGYVRLLQIRDFKSDKYAVYIPISKNNKLCKKDDIMIGRYGASVGQIHRGKEGAYNVALIKTIPDTSLVDRDYLYFYLISPLFQTPLASVAARSAQAGFSKEDIYSFQIPLPPLPEQRRIVAILDEAFAGLETMRVNAEKNLQNANELFDAYLNNLFNRPHISWRAQALGDVCEFIGGSQPPKSDFSSNAKDGFIRLIQIRDYKSDKHIVFIPRNKARRFCDETDVMIGRYGPPLFQILRGLNGAYNVALMKAKPNEELISKDFLYYFLRNSTLLDYIIKSSHRAAGQTGLKKETIEPYPIHFPHLLEQTDVVDKLRTLEAQTELLSNLYQQKLLLINELQQSLLHKAFSGELASSDMAA